MAVIEFGQFKKIENLSPKNQLASNFENVPQSKFYHTINIFSKCNRKILVRKKFLPLLGQQKSNLRKKLSLIQKND